MLESRLHKAGVNPSASLTKTNPPILYQEAPSHQQSQQIELQIQSAQVEYSANHNKRQVDSEESSSDSDSMSIEESPEKPIVMEDYSRKKKARSGNSGSSSRKVVLVPTNEQPKETLLDRVIDVFQLPYEATDKDMLAVLERDRQEEFEKFVKGCEKIYFDAGRTERICELEDTMIRLAEGR